jgi:hypothetical protein
MAVFDLNQLTLQTSASSVTECILFIQSADRTLLFGAITYN